MSILTQEEAYRLLTNFNCCFIHKGEKRPIGSNWQSNPRKFSEWRDQGVGVICGRLGDIAIHALDFDTSDAELSDACKSWLRDYLCDRDGAILIRVGKHPKFLIPFVIDDEIRKSEFTSKKFYPEGEEPTKKNSNQLEVLGTNCQFVAYHIHPDTGEPYKWHALIDSEHDTLHEIRPYQLLKLTRDDLTTIRSEFELKARSHGLKEKESEKVLAPIAQVGKSDSGYTLDEVLPYLKNDDSDYDDWVKVGMAIEAAGGQFSDWLDYSEQSSKHNPEGMEDKWISFTNKLGGVGMGTLVMLAKQNGLPSKTGIAPQRSYEDLLSETQQLNATSDPSTIEALVHQTCNLKIAERDGILKSIRKKTSTSMRVLTEILDNFRETEGVGLPDELALALLIINDIGAENILSVSSSVWRWDGSGVWYQIEKTNLKQIVQDSLPGIINKVTARLVGAVSDVINTQIYKPFHEFNVGNPETVNCLNGELVLTDGKWTLTPHCREHYRTTQIPVVYDPDAKAPQFERFLEQIFMGDADAQDKAQALLEMIGYTLMAHCEHEKFVILVGVGSNGKSVLLSIIEGLCGRESVAAMQPSQFDNKFQRAHLHMKLANIVTEVKEGAVIDDAALKGIVSGEPTTVEHKHKAPFVMRPFATCWFGTNHMPHTRDFSDALFRRALVLTLNQVFKPELNNHDPKLTEKLMTELPGILNLALAAYSNALQQGFTTPASAAEARNDWRLQVDQVAQFIYEQYESDPSSSVEVSVLYQAYIIWAIDNGIHNKVTKKTFRDRLTRLGFGNDRNNRSRLVTGLRLKTDYETDFLA